MLKLICICVAFQKKKIESYARCHFRAQLGIPLSFSSPEGPHRVEWIYYCGSSPLSPEAIGVWISVVPSMYCESQTAAAATS